MRLQISLVAITLGLILAACQKQPVAVFDREANNPFRYSKKSAVCKVAPIVTQTDGSLKTSMSVRSDDGYCEFIVEQPKPKGSYASFGISETAEHGKTFLYNYDNRTYIRYTPTMAYAGSDKFTANLIHRGEAKKTKLMVDVTVDATGVVAPKPVVQPEPVDTTKKKASVRRRRTTKHTIAAKKQSN